jgi:hypothetical protein
MNKNNELIFDTFNNYSPTMNVIKHYIPIRQLISSGLVFKHHQSAFLHRDEERVFIIVEQTDKYISNDSSLL